GGQAGGSAPRGEGNPHRSRTGPSSCAECPFVPPRGTLFGNTISPRRAPQAIPRDYGYMLPVVSGLEDFQSLRDRSLAGRFGTSRFGPGRSPLAGSTTCTLPGKPHSGPRPFGSRFACPRAKLGSPGEVSSRFRFILDLFWVGRRGTDLKTRPGTEPGAPETSL